MFLVLNGLTFKIKGGVPLIKFRNVTMQYPNGTKAIEDVSLQIDKGEFVFVVGASGAGKSTFLKLIMREEKATSGHIEVNGYNLNKLKHRRIPEYRRSIGMVFQDFKLIPTMNVYDNVAFALRVTDVSTRDIKRRVPYVLNLVGLSHKMKSMPEELSGGEQQRVALARALVNNPQLLIADEPTGNVDPEMSLEIVELLTEINRCGTTIIMVTHEHDLVHKFNKRVITIDKGEVIADAPEKESV